MATKVQELEGSILGFRNLITDPKLLETYDRYFQLTVTRTSSIKDQWDLLKGLANTQITWCSEKFSLLYTAYQMKVINKELLMTAVQKGEITVSEYADIILKVDDVEYNIVLCKKEA